MYIQGERLSGHLVHGTLSKCDTFNQCCFYVGSASMMMDQHLNIIGWAFWVQCLWTSVIPALGQCLNVWPSTEPTSHIFVRITIVFLHLGVLGDHLLLCTPRVFFQYLFSYGIKLVNSPNIILVIYLFVICVFICSRLLIGCYDVCCYPL